MGTLLNRRRVMGGGGGTPLPYDAEIEYLESTGTQWIDTNFIATDGALYEYEGAFEQVSSAIVSSKDTTGEVYIKVSYYNYYNVAIWKYGAQYIRVNPRLDTFYNIYYDTRNYTKILKWNGEEVYNTDTANKISNTESTCIFRDGSSIVNGKIKSLKITSSSDELVFDAIPVRVGQVGYMYDKVSGRLFGNAGTGDFILGNDK